MILNPGSENRLVLFVRDGCEFCEEAIDMAKDISRAEILIYMVYPSRIEGRAEIRPYRNYERINGIPTLIKQEIVEDVPVLYDPFLDDVIVGLESIEKYFDDYLRD